MKTKFFFLAMLLVAAFAFSANAQTETKIGTVKQADGKTVRFVIEENVTSIEFGTIKGFGINFQKTRELGGPSYDVNGNLRLAVVYNDADMKIYTITEDALTLVTKSKLKSDWLSQASGNTARISYNGGYPCIVYSHKADFWNFKSIIDWQNYGGNTPHWTFNNNTPFVTFTLDEASNGEAIFKFKDVKNNVNYTIKVNIFENK